MEQPLDRIQWVHDTSGQTEFAAKYDQWEKQYDADLVDALGYVGPKPVADRITDLLPVDARVLDGRRGDGPRRRGVLRRGFLNLTASTSPVAYLTRRAARVSTQSSARWHSASRWISRPTRSTRWWLWACSRRPTPPTPGSTSSSRVTRPGGFVVYSLRSKITDTGSFAAKHAELESTRKWRIVAVTEPFSLILVATRQRDTSIGYFMPSNR